MVWSLRGLYILRPDQRPELHAQCLSGAAVHRSGEKIPQREHTLSALQIFTLYAPSHGGFVQLHMYRRLPQGHGRQVYRFTPKKVLLGVQDQIGAPL